MNLHRQCVAIRQGRVEAVWPIEASGATIDLHRHPSSESHRTFVASGLRFRMKHGDMTDASCQMSAEIVVPLPILAVRAVADAVGEDGLEAIVFHTPHVGPDIQHHAGHLLANALPHEVRFACVHFKPLFERDAANMDVKAADAAFQCFAAGENEVVGIVRIRGIQRAGQPREPAIEPISGHRFARAGDVGVPCGK